MSQDYFSDFNELNAKLTDVLEEAGLVHTFKADAYPIALVVKPQADVSTQMQLFSADNGTSSLDMSMILTFRLDGLEIRTDNRLVMPDALMTKIKGMAKKLHYAYLQADFAMRNDFRSRTRIQHPAGDMDDDVFGEFLASADDSGDEDAD